LKNLILKPNENTVKEIKTEGEATRKAIEEMRVDNNSRQAYFIIDSIKAITPTTQINEKALKRIITSFNKHGLGELNEGHLNSYYRDTKSSESAVGNNKYRPNKND
jgi:hypothetical protein